MIRKSYPWTEKDLPTTTAPVAKRNDREAPYLTKGVLLEGWPGNRTLPGKSGLDPLENHYEVAHILGILLRQWFWEPGTRHGSLYLLLAPALGILLAAPLALSLYQAWWGDLAPLSGWVIIFPLGALGLLILARFIHSLLWF